MTQARGRGWQHSVSSLGCSPLLCGSSCHFSLYFPIFKNQWMQGLLLNETETQGKYQLTYQNICNISHAEYIQYVPIVYINRGLETRSQCFMFLET